MTQEALQVVRQGYDAWNRDDFEAVRSLLHPDGEWRTTGAFLGFEPVYRGHDGVRSFWETLKEPWDYFTVHIERTLEADGVVVVDLRFEAVGTGSGVKVDSRAAHVWEVEAGLVVRYTAYSSLEEALAAAGLQE